MTERNQNEQTEDKCNRCQGRGEAQCAKWEPEEALTLVTSDVLAQKTRIGAVKKLFQESKT